MNTEPQITSEPAAAEVSRRNGNIAQLPKATRDKINQMLLDGVFYTDIIKNLGDEGKHLQICNVSRWKDGGYQDWLKERQEVNALRSFFELVIDMVANADAEEIPDLTVKLLAARVCGMLTKLTPAELHANVSDDPKTLSRLLGLVPKLSREALRTRKFRRSIQRDEAQQLKERDPNKPFGDEDDHRAVVDIVDKVLGLGRHRRKHIPALDGPLPGPAVSANGNPEIAPESQQSLND